MTRQKQTYKLNLQALAESAVPLIQHTPLQDLDRLVCESTGRQPDYFVTWQTSAELRMGATGQMDMWLHLQANTSVPLTCQRCMAAVQVPLEVDRRYRFVASEDIAMLEDDASEEDLLVMAPQFDLLALLEDELLMALPLVPMHDPCPVLPAFSAGTVDLPDPVADKPNPFVALAQLKEK